MTSRVVGDERLHPLEVALAPERGPALALLREDPVEHELGRDAGVVEPGQEQRLATDHARVADHEVLDRRPLRVAEVERARDVGRRLDEHERGQVDVRGGAGAVGGEDVGGQPPLVDAVLELRGQVRLRELPALVAACLLGHRSLPKMQTTRSSSGRTGSWYHLLVRCRGRSAHRGRLVRRPHRRAIGRHPHGSRATFGTGVPARLAPSRARLEAVPGLLLSVVAVRPPLYHPDFAGQAGGSAAHRAP